MPTVPDLTRRGIAEARAAEEDVVAEEQGQAPPDSANPDEVPVVEVLTAVVMVITREGDVLVTHDINAPIVPDREPSRDEVSMMAHKVIQDYQTQEIAQMATQTMMANMQAQAQKAVQARQQAEIQAALDAESKAGGNLPPGLRRRKG